MVGTLDSQVIEKFKEFQDKTGKYLDLDIKNVVFNSLTVESIFDIVRRGASPRPIKNYQVDKNYNGVKYNWLKIGDVTKSNIYLKETNEYINEHGKNSSVLGKKGDFLITNSMTVGVPIILDIETCFHDGFLYLGFNDTDQNRYDNLYLYYFFTSYRQALISKSKDGIVKNLNTDIIKTVFIPMPQDYNKNYKSIDIQKAIVEFLEYSFDNLEGIKSNIDKRYDIVTKMKKSLIPSIFKRSTIKNTFKKYAKKNNIDYDITDIIFDVKDFDLYVSLEKGKSKYTAKYINKNKGDYPLYSSGTDDATKGLMGKINTFDYDVESIQFTANGEKAGTIFKLNKHKFSMNGDRGMFVPKTHEIDFLFLYYNLKNEFLKHQFSWANKPTNTKIKEKIKIYIPKIEGYSSILIEKDLANFIEYMNKEIDEKYFKKYNRLYEVVELLRETYLKRTFSKIVWS